MKRTVHQWWIVTVIGFLGLVLFSEAGAVRALPEFSQLVERHSAAVVNISISQEQWQRQQSQPQVPEPPVTPEDSPLYDFLQRFFGEGEIEDFGSQSLGSGFVISPDGYVLTNGHVIENASEINVRLSDRREYQAHVVGVDDYTDIALLKIEAAHLPSVKLGTGVDVKVGEWVLAIGSPFGFEHSVTAGIVSAKGRSLPTESYVPFIQTDVAINPGNSGGPLFNLEGEVVGVNSQIFSRTGGFMGLSFAIPIDVAMNVADQLRTRGRVSRGWLGVLIQEVTRELAESFGMQKPEGALVAQVLLDSPAARAGLQVGDVVLAFNEQPVERHVDLPPLVGRTQVDSRASVKILRDGRIRILEVGIEELPDKKAITRTSSAALAPLETDNPLGVVVTDLNREQRAAYGVGEHGVIVEEVEGRPASQAGLQEGDIILMLDGVEITDRAHFERLANGLPGGKAVSVLVHRGGRPLFLALRKAR